MIYLLLGFLQNRLSDLPTTLPLLRNLKTLDISQNLLTKLNESLFEISSLEFLVAVGNRLEYMHIERGPLFSWSLEPCSYFLNF